MLKKQVELPSFYLINPNILFTLDHGFPPFSYRVPLQHSDR